jgi:hypothetical protein
VKQLREQESILQAEIQGTKRTSRNLSDRIRELDAQSLAQQEHVYAAEFQIQQMERKVCVTLHFLLLFSRHVKTWELDATHRDAMHTDVGVFLADCACPG